MENPFSTKFWMPGALPFHFTEQSETVDSLLEKAAHHSYCQIAGPHGSGKTTLLLALWKRYNERGKQGGFLWFHTQNRRPPAGWLPDRETRLFVDGIEQLPLYRSMWLFYKVKRMVFTVHKPVWFVPVLYRTEPLFSVFAEFAQKMSPHVPEESELRRIYDTSGGNFRSCFFELYDRWEKMSSASDSAAAGADS